MPSEHNSLAAVAPWSNISIGESLKDNSLIGIPAASFLSFLVATSWIMTPAPKDGSGGLTLA
jgi:hypothetical protein